MPPLGTLLLGHGAGGGIEAPDLLAATDAAVGVGWRVLRVEQPWRVAGKRVAAAPPRLDEGWTAIHAGVADLLTGPVVVRRAQRRGPGGLPDGGAAGCRRRAVPGVPAAPTGQAGQEPGAGADRGRPCRSLVVQGDSDAFGGPAEVQGALGDHPAQVVAVRGDHALKADPPAVRTAVGTWLAALT